MIMRIKVLLSNNHSDINTLYTNILRLLYYNSLVKSILYVVIWSNIFDSMPREAKVFSYSIHIRVITSNDNWEMGAFYRLIDVT